MDDFLSPTQIYLMYPSGKKPIEKVWTRESKLIHITDSLDGFPLVRKVNISHMSMSSGLPLCTAVFNISLAVGME